jgi:hypothetical protein
MFVLCVVSTDKKAKHRTKCEWSTNRVQENNKKSAEGRQVSGVLCR